MSVFVDTSAWFAYLVHKDPDYPAATQWMSMNSQPLITSDYIIDETLTLLLYRASTQAAFQMGQLFFLYGIAHIEFVSPDDISNAWKTFEQYRDKNWSFTDCTSKVIMERLKIPIAFSFDKHFRRLVKIKKG